MTSLSDDPSVVQRILDHIDNKTTDLSETSWREPVANYRSEERFAAELGLVLRRYHIRSTHAQTFYPVQFDNLNVVETFGRNNRVAFPYRAINKLRAVPPAERSTDGKLTYVYHLFPNVMVATFPASIFMTVLEPLATDRTMFITYVLTDRGENDGEAQAALKGGADLVDHGAAEDQAVARAIQQGLTSGANEFFEFGRFEGAISHFHRTLHATIDRSGT